MVAFFPVIFLLSVYWPFCTDGVTSKLKNFSQENVIHYEQYVCGLEDNIAWEGKLKDEIKTNNIISVKAHPLPFRKKIVQILINANGNPIFEDEEGTLYNRSGNKITISKQDKKIICSLQTGYNSSSLINSTDPFLNSQCPIYLSSSTPDLPEEWQWKYLGYLGADPNSLAPNENGKTLLECYLQGINPQKEIPEEPFTASLVATGPFYAPATINLVANVTHSVNHKIDRVELYQISSQGKAQFLEQLTEKPYQFTLPNLKIGNYQYEIRVYDNDSNLQTARTNFEVLSSNCYTRGWGNKLRYLSSIIALDGEKGIRLDDILDFQSIYSNGYPWFLRTTSELKELQEPCYHIYCDTNSNAIDYLPANTVPKIGAEQVGGQPPLVAFGSKAGKTPLYVNQWYSIGIRGAGEDLQATGDIQDIRIEVYDKASFEEDKKNVTPVCVKTYTLPRNGNKDKFKTWGKNFFIDHYSIYEEVNGKKIDFDTEIYLSTDAASLELADFNTDNQILYPALLLKHKSNNDNFFYRIIIKGLTTQQFESNNAEIIGINNNLPLIPLSKDSQKQQQTYNLSYTLDFDQSPSWMTKVLDFPHFKSASPDFYQGKSIDELINHTSIVKDTLPSPYNIGLNLKKVDKYESPELKTHPKLDQLVEDLEYDPLRIANYVQKEIELTDALDAHFGETNNDAINCEKVRRDALATYLEGQGSPIEQCTLLIYLLRKAGISCAYIFPKEDKPLLFDEQLSSLLKIQLRGAIDAFGNNKNPEIIPINYPWVAAYINGKWVHLFPWLKDIEITEGKDLWSYFPKGYDTEKQWLIQYLLNDSSIRSLSQEDNPGTLFPLYASNQLPSSLTLDDVGIKYKNRQKNDYTNWDDFPRPWKTPVVSLDNLAQNLDAAQNPNLAQQLENIFDTISIKVFSDRNRDNKFINGEPMVETGPIKLVDLHDRRFLVFHQKNPSSSQYRLILSLEPYDLSETNLEAHSFHAGINPDSNNSLRNPQQAEALLSSEDKDLSFSITYDNKEYFSMLYKGEMSSFVINYGRVTQKMLNFESKKFWEYQNFLAESTPQKANQEQAMGQLLYILGKSYFYELGKFKTLNQQLSKIIYVSTVEFSLNSIRPIIKPGGELLITNNNGTEDIDLRIPCVDIIRSFSSIIRDQDVHLERQDQFLNYSNDKDLLIFGEGSSLEHRTLNQFFKRDDSISTVRLLDLAYNWRKQEEHTEDGIAVLNANTSDEDLAKEYFSNKLFSVFDGIRHKKMKAGNSLYLWLIGTEMDKILNPMMFNFCLITPAPMMIPNQQENNYLEMGAFIFFPAGGIQALITGPFNITSYNSDLKEITNNSQFDKKELVASLGYSNHTFILNGGLSGKLAQSTWINNMPAQEVINSTLDLSPDGRASFSYQNTNTTYFSGLNNIYNNYDSKLSLLANEKATLTPDFQSMLTNFQNQCFSSSDKATIPNAGQKASQYASLIWDKGFLGATSFFNWGKRFIADPVNPVTGEFYINDADLTLTGPMPLELRRNYSSQNQANNNLGYGWKLSNFPYLSFSIDVDEDGKEKQSSLNIPKLIYAAEADGSIIAYHYQEGSSSKIWIPLPIDNPILYNSLDEKINLKSKNGLNNKIIATSDSTYDLKGCDGSIRHYATYEYPLTRSPKITRKRAYLDSWEDGNGNKLIFERGNNPKDEDWGELKKISSNNGNSILFKYDPYGHITDALSNDGSHVKYSYDSYGDLVQVTLPDNSITNYAYEHKQTLVDSNLPSTTYSTHLLMSEKKPEGRLLTNTYDANRRVITQSARTGKGSDIKLSSTFKYDLQQNSDQTTSGKTTLTDALGHTTVYDIANNLIIKVTNQKGEALITLWNAEKRQKVSQTDLRGLKTDYSYDNYGNLTQITQTGNLTGKNNNEIATTTLTYNSNNILTSITDPLGNKNSYSYSDTAHPLLPTSITQPGSIITYTYTNAGSDKTTACGLISTENNNGTITSYTYNSRGFVSSITKKTGTHDPSVTTNFLTDRRGEIIESSLPSGTKIKNEYDAMGRSISKEIYDPTGNLIDWHYIYYDGNGEVTWEQGARFNPVDYTYASYDHMGRITEKSYWQSQAAADGNGVVDAGLATTFFSYDDLGNMTAILNPNHNITTMEYDAVGNVTTIAHRQGDSSSSPILSKENFTYQPGGDVIAHATLLGGTETMSYTSKGQLIEKRQADGTILHYRYDLLGRINEVILQNGSKWVTSYNDNAHAVTHSYLGAEGKQYGQEIKQYDARGNLILYTDLAGNTFKNSYDNLNRLKTTDGPSSTQSIRYVYNDERSSHEEINAIGEHVLTFVDSLNRPIWKGIYNKDGSIAQNISNWYSGDHQNVLTTVGTGANAITTSTWSDSRGNPLIIKHADGSSQKFSYDANGNMTSSTDEEGSTTSYAYDALNHLALQTLPGGATIKYTCDPAGNLLTRSMPEGLTEQNSYNTAGQKTASFLFGSDDLKTRNYTYQYQNGLLSSITDPRGFTTSISYDGWQRPINISSSGSSIPQQNQTTTYTYDPRGLITSVTQASTSGSTLVSRAYDAYGQLTSETTSLNGSPLSTWTQTWDAAGRRTALNWSPGNTSPGAQYAFSYNALGELTSAHNASGTCSYVYGDNGLLSQKSTPSGTTTFTRDNNGNIITATLPEISTESITYRADGKVSSYAISGSAGNETRNYQYDARGRIVQEPYLLAQSTNNLSAGTQKASYTFDDLNIRLKQEITADVANVVSEKDSFSQVTLDSLNFDASTPTSWTSGYDAQGNLTTHNADSNNQLLTWDSFGHLVNVDQTGNAPSTWSTIYDGLGRRIQTKAQGNTINYYYDPEVEFLELGHSINGNRQWNLYGPDRSGLYGGAQGIGGLETCYTENTKSSVGIVNNYFGDVVGLVSAGTFTPYPSALGAYGPMPGSSVNQALQPQWRGHYLDPTGFVYMGARYYDPQEGRFLSADPLGHGSSWNLYDYCAGDPVNGLDPDGRCVEGASAGWANGEGSFAGTYDSSQANSQLAYGLGWTVGGALGTINGMAASVTTRPLAAIGQGYNEVTDFAEENLNLAPGSLTAATFMFAPLAVTGEVSELAEGTTSSAFPAGYQGGPGAMWRGEKLDQLSEALNPSVFRQGTFANESVGWKGNLIKGKQWSAENPLTTPNYAKKYGLPEENTGNPDWIVGGRIRGGYTTRQAPPSHNNPGNTGGGKEILPNNPNDVFLDFFHMP